MVEVPPELSEKGLSRLAAGAKAVQMAPDNPGVQDTLAGSITAKGFTAPLRL